MIINFNTKTNKLKKGIKARALALVARKRSFEEFSGTETLKKMTKNKKKAVDDSKENSSKGLLQEENNSSSSSK